MKTCSYTATIDIITVANTISLLSLENIRFYKPDSLILDGGIYHFCAGLKFTDKKQQSLFYTITNDLKVQLMGIKDKKVFL